MMKVSTAAAMYDHVTEEASAAVHTGSSVQLVH